MKKWKVCLWMCECVHVWFSHIYMSCHCIYCISTGVSATQTVYSKIMHLLLFYDIGFVIFSALSGLCHCLLIVLALCFSLAASVVRLGILQWILRFSYWIFLLSLVSRVEFFRFLSLHFMSLCIEGKFPGMCISTLQHIKI